MKDSRAAAVISFAYAFLSDHGGIVNDDDFKAGGEGAVKILGVRDSRSKAVFAHAAPVKGIDEKGYAVNALVDDVKWLGYISLTLKSDNEPAIVKLLLEAFRDLRISGDPQLSEEHPPEYNPMSNGSAELGAKFVKGQIRCLRSDLEEKIGIRIPVRHLLIAWLVRHAANLII